MSDRPNLIAQTIFNAPAIDFFQVPLREAAGLARDIDDWTASRQRQEVFAQTRIAPTTTPALWRPIQLEKDVRKESFVLANHVLELCAIKKISPGEAKSYIFEFASQLGDSLDSAAVRALVAATPFEMVRMRFFSQHETFVETALKGHNVLAYADVLEHRSLEHLATRLQSLYYGWYLRSEYVDSHEMRHGALKDSEIKCGIDIADELVSYGMKRFRRVYDTAEVLGVGDVERALGLEKIFQKAFKLSGKSSKLIELIWGLLCLQLLEFYFERSWHIEQASDVLFQYSVNELYDCLDELKNLLPASEFTSSCEEMYRIAFL